MKINDVIRAKISSDRELVGLVRHINPDDPTHAQVEFFDGEERLFQTLRGDEKVTVLGPITAYKQ